VSKEKHKTEFTYPQKYRSHDKNNRSQEKINEDDK
jgi:hypothetical protein